MNSSRMEKWRRTKTSQWIRCQQENYNKTKNNAQGAVVKEAMENKGEEMNNDRSSEVMHDRHEGFEIQTMPWHWGALNNTGALSNTALNLTTSTSVFQPQSDTLQFRTWPTVQRKTTFRSPTIWQLDSDINSIILFLFFKFTSQSSLTMTTPDRPTQPTFHHRQLSLISHKSCTMHSSTWTSSNPPDHKYDRSRYGTPNLTT